MTTAPYDDDPALSAAWENGYNAGYEDGSEDTWNACHDT